jgi:N-acetyl-anhydromuramyl-L-alanine amidase AmpD
MSSGLRAAVLMALAAGCDSGSMGPMSWGRWGCRPSGTFVSGPQDGVVSPAPASGAAREWQYIVVHHSATPTGNAAEFDREHRRKGWDELGYHFVIDNGLGGPDGRIETGSRWTAQKHGAHTGGTPNNEYNDRGIGICLVGNFEETRPTAAQLDSLRRLVLHLARLYGIPSSHVIGHRDAPNAKTLCPGRYMASHLGGALRPAVARAAWGW